MRVSIGFSGPAGAGIVTAGVTLGNILAKKGYFVVGDKEYESIIKGGNNLFVLYVSDEGNFISKEIDYFFYYDNYGLEKNENIYDIKNQFELKKSDFNYQNTASVAMAMKILGIDCAELKAEFEEKFAHKPEVVEKNVSDIEKACSLIEKSELDLSGSVGDERVFWYGNEAIGIGAIDSDLEFYAAYPMTPASSIIEVVTDKKNWKDSSLHSEGQGPIFFQGEDEIAVSMAMLGAHFTGKRSACGTSGGGFALMTESISYANQAELGGLYILSQRAGPSTGTPTYTEQGDIDFALNASFGGTYPIVVCPDNLEDGYNLVGKALNWSDQYQHPVIYLVDKLFSESYFALNKKDLKAEPVNRGKRVDSELSEDDFARFEVTEDGISPYTVPGVKNGEFIATSYEHDIYGATSEDPLEKKIMTEKRFKKIEKTFVNEVFNEEFYGYEVVNSDAKKFFVSLGTNSVVLRDAVKNNPERGLILVKVLQPVDPRLTQFFEDKFDVIKELVFVEQNYSGQFEQHLKTQCNLRTPEWENKISHKRKYTNYPFFGEDFNLIDNG